MRRSRQRSTSIDELKASPLHGGNSAPIRYPVKSAKKFISRIRSSKGKAIFIFLFVGFAVIYLSTPNLSSFFDEYNLPSTKSIKSSGMPPPMEIRIGLATPHFYTGAFFDTRSCKGKNQPLKCTVDYIVRPEPQLNHVKLYHGPHSHLIRKIQRDYPSQLLGMFSMEATSRFTIQNDTTFLDNFDFTLSFRWDSDIPALYSSPYLIEDKLFDPVRVPTPSKITALVYINSNCNALNGRNDIVEQIMDIGDIPVHNYGKCLNNRHAKENEVKEDIISKYKFCIAMENSNEEDYVTEKLWQSLTAGCLPIYQGAPNIEKFLPVPAKEMILNYAEYGSAKALSDELVRLSNNDEEYNKYFEWKKINPRKDEVLEGFQWMMNQTEAQPICDICRHAASIWETRKNASDYEDYKQFLSDEASKKDRPSPVNSRLYEKVLNKP